MDKVDADGSAAPDEASRASSTCDSLPEAYLLVSRTGGGSIILTNYTKCCNLCMHVKVACSSLLVSVRGGLAAG